MSFYGKFVAMRVAGVVAVVVAAIDLLRWIKLRLEGNAQVAKLLVLKKVVNQEARKCATSNISVQPDSLQSAREMILRKALDGFYVEPPDFERIFACLHW